MILTLIYHYLFTAIWVSYIVYWRIMAKDVKSPARVEPAWSRLARLVLILCVAFLFFLPRIPIPLLYRRFLPLGALWFWVGVAVTLAGLSFSIWARRKLGRNWSSEVTVMQEHELITAGPYRLVRHPIYTGLLLGVIGTAIALGEWRGLLAVVLLFFVLYHKLTLEEKWMREHFGESYATYVKRTAALVPFLV